MMRLVLLGGALLMSTAVSAQTARAGSEPESSANDPDRVICRTIASTESRLSRTRVCKSRAEWAAERRGPRASNGQSQANPADPSE